MSRWPVLLTIFALPMVGGRAFAAGGEIRAWPDSLRPFPPEPYSLHDVEISFEQAFTCGRGVNGKLLVRVRGEGSRCLSIFENGRLVYRDSLVMAPSGVLRLLGRFYRDDFFNWRPSYPELDFGASLSQDSAALVGSRMAIEPPLTLLTNHLAVAVGDYAKSVSWPGRGPYFVNQLAGQVLDVVGWRFDDWRVRHCASVKRRSR
jgi:hypothetical protein